MAQEKRHNTMTASVTKNITELHAALSDYIEATYHISHPSLVVQRKALLNAVGIIHQKPYIESTPKYLSGRKFAEIPGLPKEVIELFEALANSSNGHDRIIFDPPYKHQWESVEGILVKQKNLMIMTGTGSGKTESFLLPIIGKLAAEASITTESFKNNGVRALILYPMNALVNDQLGRVRNLFQDSRLKSFFKSKAGRIPTFARYTSRTPYPGVRDAKKDQKRLKSFEEFYISIEQATTDENSETRQKAIKLMVELKKKGKWPAKPSISEWYGTRNTHWQNSSGDYLRAITLPEDSELITRQEIQRSAPDLLITNYSMLEYMLMRPIEQTIFEQTSKWLAENKNEKFLIVIDEAHLYRGAAGAEVGLLLRRLRTRLGITEDRFQVICATASFQDHDYALRFASELSGNAKESFIPITGSYNYQKVDLYDAEWEAKRLSGIDLERFYEGIEAERMKFIENFIRDQGVNPLESVEASLYEALKNYAPLAKLVNLTMGQAIPIDNLGVEIFPNVDTKISDRAVAILLALGSLAKQTKSEAGLLPCRVHTFFRGLPGLWACIDPNCIEIEDENRSLVCGKIYSQPRSRCDCGARVFELFTCRNCGTAHIRAYTDNIENPSALWSEPGNNIRLIGSNVIDLFPLDLLLETPVHANKTEPAFLDIKTGRLNPNDLGDSFRRVYIRRERQVSEEQDDENEIGGEGEVEETLGMFVTCSVCAKSGGSRESAVQDHQTKGDQPFLALLSRQIQIQPPNSAEATRFAPLRGRKVLIFSDSRQVAAKLAPNLQMYSLRDSVRPLMVWGFRAMANNPLIAESLCLDDAYLAVLIGANKFKLRLRPELSSSHNFFSIEQRVRNEIENGVLDNEMKFFQFYVKYRTEEPPESLLKEIVGAIYDRFTGLEPLALATICIKKEFTDKIVSLPSIEPIATTNETKLALANFWIRCWQSSGYWIKGMPPNWWKPAEGRHRQGVRPHKGNFKAVDQLIGQTGKRIFNTHWLPELKNLADDLDGVFRMSGKNLSLDFGNNWVRCSTCSSVHRPITSVNRCLDCHSLAIETLNPDENAVFVARKGYYRSPVKGVFSDPPTVPMALVSAEHTAQLNSPQSEDVFSKGEENELLFQDINVEWPLGTNNACAIDILSSTTTMEVGIDIGALSGVALRNMPPGRANYQQRSGRAGRRGNSIATVVAYGSVDSHDEHYFSHPQEMISGKVVDPIITLNNIDIAKRHVRAFLLQKYHQQRLPIFLPSHHKANLFSVLGTVKDFILDTTTINRNNFLAWLNKETANLKDQIGSWIPNELSNQDKEDILSNFVQDVIEAIDESIDYALVRSQLVPESSSETNEEEDIEANEQADLGKMNLSDGLLDRLLYRGKLPRYAFPTDVATFYIFDQNNSTQYKTAFKFVPSQGLPIALSQYAPGKQVWVSNKCYTSGAIYSPIPGELAEAWKKRKLYYECVNCGFAKTEAYDSERRHQVSNCDACGEELNQPFVWLRPPGFAHPVDVAEETSPDGMPEVSYATRAKLYMPFPDPNKWKVINNRVAGLSVRTHLLISNTGPSREAYQYCVRCGRIESEATFTGTLNGEHPKPFPDENPTCQGGLRSTIVLGTDFITDVCLLSIDLAPTIRLSPGSYTTNVALRTVCEALSKAASQMLEIEATDIMAEYRPALTSNISGRIGDVVEIFLYDTLPGGAGFASQLVDRGAELFARALNIMESCQENCDLSCYRCLRSFKNKFEHRMLDRHVGIDLIKFILTGSLPALDDRRIQRATADLFEDLQRNNLGDIVLTTKLPGSENDNMDMIFAVNEEEKEFVISVSNPLIPTVPLSVTVQALINENSGITVLPIDEYLVRNNLPSATQWVLQKIRNVDV
ncbi:DEAD/DEAH box helicase [Mucilaginibacter sp. Mucisp86]|uniref:DEAD/DEAH box helicase n=1 Tax=Mucilaginibacter sp. Mucisp86 TaxID=3243060 RepID=UPI0039B615AB